MYLFELVFSRYTPRSGIPGSYSNYIFSFLRTSILFSIVAAPIFIPTNRQGFFLNYGFLRVYVQQWDCWVIWQFYFQFYKEPPYCSPQWLYLFTLPPTVQEGSLFSTPAPAFMFSRFFDDGHSDRCEIISHCSFDLHFSND